MIYVSEIERTAPTEYKTDLQKKVYHVLGDLQIPFERVGTDEVITMEDCEKINKKLNMDMVKTLFLCNRQQTDFYLFITKGDKPFHAKDFSGTLGVSRVSFAPAEKMESMLGTKIGAATVFSMLLDTADRVKLVFDKEVVDGEYYGCSDGTTTGYMKIKTELIIKNFCHLQSMRQLLLGCEMNLYHNRIIVKVGTSTLTNEMGQSNFRSFDRLACVIADIQNMGYEVILVSSGAIAVGTNKMSLKNRPSSIRHKQAAASVGQCRIIHLYSKYFQEYDKIIGQILLSSADVTNEKKKENLINTFNTLLEMGIIPVVNANDSVSYDEIQSEEQLFGDNDMLSAVVAVLCQANKLVIFSDIDGLYDSDPHRNVQAHLISKIDRITDEMYQMAGGAGSRRGTGGMRTKLKAAQYATEQGIDTIITNGKNPSSLYGIVNGESIGTLFTGG